MKKSLMLLCILVAGALMVSCQKTDDKNATFKTEDESTVQFQYKELSDISPMCYNNTVKYTKEHTDAPLYEWSDNVVLPVPKPEGAIEEEISSYGLLAFSGVTQDNWNKYVEELKKNYSCSSFNEVTGEGANLSGSILIYDEEYNFNVYLEWCSQETYNYDMTRKNVVRVHCYMGNQEKSSEISKAELLKKVCKKLGLSEEDTKDFHVYDISSHNNMQDGFTVKYITTTLEYRTKEQNNICSYVAIIMENDLVGLVPNVAIIPTGNKTIEFLKNGDKWIMYIVTDQEMKEFPYMSDIGEMMIDIYELKNKEFSLTETKKISDIECCKDVTYITIKKNRNSIDLYELVLDSDTTIYIYDKWHIGKKLGMLNSSEQTNHNSQLNLKYKETSEISMFAADDIFKYTNEYTSCELYRWSDEIILPIPAPEGNIDVKFEYRIELDNITKEIWGKYVNVLKERYITDIETSQFEDYRREFVSIFDMKNNFTATMGWSEEEENMYIYLYMFCQENVSSLTNEEVAVMVADKLGMERKDIKAVLNASSNTNLTDGFDVYYIWNNNNSNSEELQNYICVVKDKEIVFLKADKIHVGLVDEIEFAKYDGNWYMYLLMQTNNSGTQSIEEYILKNNSFELSKTVGMWDYEPVKSAGNPVITLEKENDDIEIYIIKGEDKESIRYIKDKKLGVLDLKEAD